MLEAELRQVLWGSVSMGAKEDESSSECVWTAGFYHVTALSLLVHILKLITVSLRFKFWGDCGKLQILHQRIWGYKCTFKNKLLTSDSFIINEGKI
jgi:hypothetical protein